MKTMKEKFFFFCIHFYRTLSYCEEQRLSMVSELKNNDRYQHYQITKPVHVFTYDIITFYYRQWNLSDYVVIFFFYNGGFFHRLMFTSVMKH